MDHYVIVYDIADDRRRYRVVKALKGYAHRVQNSMFEARLTPENLSKLRRKLRWVVHPKEDLLFMYRRCGHCEEDVIRMGGEVTLMPEQEEFYFV
jgi:CRISPR-associated protein Cas2